MTQIFRITHFKNLPFIMRNGLNCPNSDIKDPDFEPIGFPTLIHNREERMVPLPPKWNIVRLYTFSFLV